MQVEFRSIWRPSWAELRPASPVSPTNANSDELRLQTQRAAERLAGAVQDLAALSGGLSIGRGTTASLWSTALLGLGTERTTASVRSSAEVSTGASAGFTPQQPAWTGPSTAAPQLSGTYTGTTDDRYRFTVTQGTILGLGSYKVQVTNQAGATLTTLTIPASQLDQVRTVGNGLSVSFGTGAMTVGDTFTIDVWAARRSSLDPSAAVGPTGIPAGFDRGESVRDGSFTVNGVAINVATTDTVSAILQRITSSAAGVDAAYDPITDRVTLTARTPGAAGSVVLGGDTSGLLSALKLDDGITVVGRDPDAERPMSQLARFAAVQAGTITVNGTGVAFDPATDSLRALLQRITDQTAVDAVLSGGDQLVVFLPRTAGAGLQLDDHGTGLLDALEIDQRSATATASRGISAHRRQLLAERLAATRSELSSLWNLGASVAVGDVRASMVETFSQLSAADRSIVSDLLGIRLAGATLQFDNRTPAELEQALARLGTSALRSLRSFGSQQHGLSGALLSLSRTVRFELQLLDG
jgi:hypothetical protein